MPANRRSGTRAEKDKARIDRKSGGRAACFSSRQSIRVETLLQQAVSRSVDCGVFVIQTERTYRSSPFVYDTRHRYAGGHLDCCTYLECSRSVFSLLPVRSEVATTQPVSAPNSLRTFTCSSHLDQDRSSESLKLRYSKALVQ